MGGGGRGGGARRTCVCVCVCGGGGAFVRGSTVLAIIRCALPYVTPKLRQCDARVNCLAARL